MNHTMKLNDYTSRQNNSQNIFEIHKCIQPKKRNCSNCNYVFISKDELHRASIAHVAGAAFRTLDQIV